MTTTQTPTTPAATPEVAAGPDFYAQLQHRCLPKWRPLLAVFTFVICGLVANGVISVLAMVGQSLIDGKPVGELRMTPLIFLGLNLSLAVLWPLSVMVQRLFFQGYQGSVTSRTGRLPWRRIGRLTLGLTPVFVLYAWLSTFAMPQGPSVGHTASTIGLIVVCLLTTPLQAAAEEVAFRGLLPRVFGSLSMNPRVSVPLAIVVPSVLFMFAHGAGDLWLNAYYLVFGLTLAVLTWKTQNLAAGIVIHTLNNVAMMLVSVLTGTDLSTMFDRSAGVGGPFMIIPMIFIPALGALVLWLNSRRRGA